jgi:hypothetical protein
MEPSCNYTISMHLQDVTLSLIVVFKLSTIFTKICLYLFFTHPPYDFAVPFFKRHPLARAAVPQVVLNPSWV